MLCPWMVTSETCPSSTACMKRVKLISGARGCCLVTIDQSNSPIRRSSNHNPRLRETGFTDTSRRSRGAYHADFSWAMHGPAGAFEHSLNHLPGALADGGAGAPHHPGNPEDLASRFQQRHAGALLARHLRVHQDVLELAGPDPRQMDAIAGPPGAHQEGLTEGLGVERRAARVARSRVALGTGARRRQPQAPAGSRVEGPAAG